MSERIHMRCIGTGQAWTLQEWFAFLKTHDSTDKAYTVGRFDYNYNDCCMNPDRETLYKFKYGQCTISLSEGKGGKWTWGVNYSCHDPYDGGGFAAGYDRAKFDTPDEARKDCAKWYADKLRRVLGEITPDAEEWDESGEHRTVNNREKIKAYRNAIADLEEMTTELRLF